MRKLRRSPAGNADRFNSGFSQNLEELRMKQLGNAQEIADTVDLGQLNLDGPIFQPTTPQVYYFHPDHLGSSTMISDGAGYAYQMFLNLPFGETMAEQRRSGTLNNPYKFNGKELDGETNLYYYGARYYDPRTSVWLSVDPLTEQTMTPYQYTYQNPVRYIDPTGMAAKDNDDWYFDSNDNSYKYDPHLTKENASKRLKSGQSWAGEEIYSDNNIKGNRDGSITDLDTGKTISKGESVMLNNGPIMKSYVKYEFKAGESYNINIERRILVGTPVGSMEKIDISNKNESITTGYGFSYPGAGSSLSPKYLKASLFLKTHSSKITFYQNVSGDSLAEIFNQTDGISNVTMGAIIYYNFIEGTRNNRLFWDANQIGHGLAVPFDATAFSEKPKFR